ncbi:Arc family DNA-binding protein [Methylorubrum extorquens]
MAKPRGRPRLPDDERKGAHLKIRTRGGTRERLEAAAARHGRSVSEEVERRLEESFLREGDAPDRLRCEIEAAYSAVQTMREAAVGGAYFLNVGDLMANALKDTLESFQIDDSWPTVAEWVDNPEIYGRFVQEAQAAVLGSLDKLRAASEVLDDPRLISVSEILSKKNRAKVEAAIAEAERRAGGAGLGGLVG